ncbi:27797_t:CDS:10, partial [Racocetra persica]
MGDSNQNNDKVGPDMPEVEVDKKIIQATSGFGYNINHIIGAGIFIIPSSIWRLALSPGSALMFWIAGALISLFGSMIYVELGARCPDGSGEQKYLEEAFDKKDNKKNRQFPMRLLNTFKGTYENGDAYIDSLPSRLLSVTFLLIITIYQMYSNRLAIQINMGFALFKCTALLFISIYGLIWSRNNGGNLWTFNNTPSDEAYKLSITEYIGHFGDAIIMVLFSYEDLTEDLNSPEEKLKVPIISNFLMNAAFITVVTPHYAINSFDVIALNFGHTLWGEPGRRFISILISLSAFGCVDSIVFMGSRAIVYAAKNGFISERLSNKKRDTPFYALLLQFYLAMLFYGFSAVCLLVLKKREKRGQFNHFQVPEILIWFYLLCTVLIAVAPMFPIPPSIYEPLSYGSFVPFIVSWIAVAII